MTPTPRIVSGMRPTGPLHLGHYFGVLKQWIALQASHQCYFFVADWHALTSEYHDPLRIRGFVPELVMDWVAAGLDPARCIIFQQSMVAEHVELHLVLSMITPTSWLERNPTYKDQLQQLAEKDLTTYGFLGYPVLQAADILLYKPYGVPVGKDQAPHLELSREIARRFNHLYGEVFPEFVNILCETPVLMGLDGRKMSKSYGNAIYLNETEEETAKKVMSAFTTPTKMRKTDPGDPENCAVCNLLRVYSPNWEVQTDECRRGLRGCVQNKRECAEAINEALRPFRERRRQIDDATVEEILRRGAEEAREFASRTLAEAKRAMGFR